MCKVYTDRVVQVCPSTHKHQLGGMTHFGMLLSKRLIWLIDTLRKFITLTFLNFEA